MEDSVRHKISLGVRLAWTKRKVRKAILNYKFPEGKEYVSYSQIKRIQMALLGKSFIGSQEAFEFGEEFHKRILEPSREWTDFGPREEMLSGMIDSVTRSELCMGLLSHNKAETELRIIVDRLGGYLDLMVLNTGLDFKTTSTTTENAFRKSLYTWDYFMQAWIYMLIGKLDNFWFVGVSKKPPYKIFEVNMEGYEEELIDAGKRIEFLLEMNNHIEVNYEK